MKTIINYWIAITSVVLSLTTSAQDFSEASLKAADLVSGEQTWQQFCAFCHTMGKGEADISGPNLHELFKRQIGKKSGFNYSAAMKDEQRQWTPELFAAYVKQPQSVVPGNSMPPVNIPAGKEVALTAYVMRKTESVNWDQAKQNLGVGGLDADLKDSHPNFWNLFIENTVKFTIPYEDTTYSFVTYFDSNGTIKGNNRGMKGIWRMLDKRNFCFTVQRIGVHPYEFMHCLNPKKFKDANFDSQYTIIPVKGFDDFTIDMAFLENRPHPLAGDAHPDYWNFLFANTMRYEIRVNKKPVIIDARFHRDGTIDSPQGAFGKWYTEGANGRKDKMCYNLEQVPGVEGSLTECFALVLMFNPRVGARWPSRFDQGNSYWCDVIAGRS